MQTAEEGQRELATTPIWQLTQARYQFLRGVKQPHILEISLVQMARFSKRGLERYQAQRAHEWDASGDCKVEYNRLVWAAYQRGEFTEQSAGVTADAKRAVYYERQAAQKADTAARLKTAQDENRILSVNAAEIGDTVYALYGSRYVEIVGKFRTSFKVKDLRSGDRFTVKAAACQWLHYNELVKAVEAGRPINPHRGPEPEPEPPTPSAPPAAVHAHATVPEPPTATASSTVAFRTAPTTRQAPGAGVTGERAEEIIRAEMARQGLIAAGWTYRLGRACREFGSCDEVKKRLNFSAPIASLNTEDDLREVVLHEVAHAKAGNDKGHGRGWKLMALAVGANPQRTCGAHIKTPDNKYHATCAGCGHVHKMTRPPKNVMCCDPCVRRHVHPYMSLTRKVDVHDRFKLIWIEQATGRSGERKSDFAAVREVPPPAPQPGEQRTAEREAWTVKPITSAVQSSLF